MALLGARSVQAVTNIVDIGLFDKQPLTAVIIAANTGGYNIIGDGQKVFDLEIGEALQVTYRAGKVTVRTLSKELGVYDKVQVKRKRWGNTFRIKPRTPNLKERLYHDNLTITAIGSRLRVINNVYLEHYVSGVVESEAGSRQTIEYYKVQSIICRTYCLSKLRRHAKEGFNLCDRVHCQVYLSKNRHNPEISKATYITKGMVVVDSDINLITASFHSNCGGQTMNAEDVWKYHVPYLRSVCDTICSAQPHAHWQRKIPRESWLKYLSRKYDYPVHDSVQVELAVNHEPEVRPVYLSPNSTVHLKRVRKDWKLESTYFSLKEEDESVVFSGNGFGHGVGLCQEGAMRMADLGVPFNQILHYYYTNVHLIDLSALDFFRED